MGAGFGGIAAAIELRRHGITDDHDPREGSGPRRHVVLQQLPGRRRATCRAICTRSRSRSDATGRACARRRRRSTPTCTTCARSHDSIAWCARTRPSAPAPGTPSAAAGAWRPRDGTVIRGGRADRRDRPAAPALAAADRGRRDLRRPQLPLGRMGSRLSARRQARGGHRHRRERRPVHPRDRAAGAAPDDLPTHRQLVPAAQEPPLPGAQKLRSSASRACRPFGAGSCSSTPSR